MTASTNIRGNAASAVTIVTGGGRGIGRQITTRLSEFRPVLIVGRNASDLQSISDECCALGRSVAFVAGSIDETSTCDAVKNFLHENNYYVEHLVCNAGIGKTGATADFDVQLWRRIFEVNVHGTFQFIRLCLPSMLERQRGNITIMSSLGGTVGVPFDAAYSASKHALVGLTRSLRMEYTKQGIQIVALCPSFIESEMTDRTIKSTARRRECSEQEARARIESRCPAKRILPATELAETIASIDGRNLQRAAHFARQGGYPIIGITVE